MCTILCIAKLNGKIENTQDLFANWRMIEDLSAIGQTTNSTPVDVCAAMPDKSVLIYYASASVTYPGGLVPVTDNGILRITRWTAARIMLEYIGEHNPLYTAFYRSGLFTAWRAV